MCTYLMNEDCMKTILDIQHITETNFFLPKVFVVHLNFLATLWWLWPTTRGPAPTIRHLPFLFWARILYIWLYFEFVTFSVPVMCYPSFLFWSMIFYIWLFLVIAFSVIRYWQNSLLKEDYVNCFTFHCFIVSAATTKHL